MNTQAEPSARQKLEAALHALTHPMGNMTDRNERVMQILKARTAYAEAAGPEAIRALLAEHDALTQAQRAEIARLRATGERLVSATNYRQGVMTAFHVEGDKRDFADRTYWNAFDEFRAVLTPQPTKD